MSVVHSGSFFSLPDSPEWREFSTWGGKAQPLLWGIVESSGEALFCIFSGRHLASKVWGLVLAVRNRFALWGCQSTISHISKWNLLTSECAMHNHVVDTSRCFEHLCKLWSRTIKWWHVWSLWELKHSRCGIQEFPLFHSSDPFFLLRDNHHPKFHDYYLSDKKCFYHICRYLPPAICYLSLLAFELYKNFIILYLTFCNWLFSFESCLPDSSMWLYWAVVHLFHWHMTAYRGDMAQFIHHLGNVQLGCCRVLSYGRAGLLCAFLGILRCLCKCFSNVYAWFIGLWKFYFIR